MTDLISLAKEKFRFSNSDVAITDFLNQEMLNTLIEKYPELSPVDLKILLQELLRFLLLAAYSPGNLLFPGPKSMELLWQDLILETALYRKICDQVHPGSFVDHSGVPNLDHSEQFDMETLHQEQLSWLSSYYLSFGPLEENRYVHLPLAESIACRLKVDLKGLNSFLKTLVDARLSDLNSIKNFKVSSFAQNILFSEAQVLDKSTSLMKTKIRDFFSGMQKHIPNANILIENDELETLFGASTSFGFTIGQHFAAVERLEQALNWQSLNVELWKKISRGDILCGLATTHLAKPGPPIMQGCRTHNGYLVSGTAPWVCGFGIFDYLVIGFEVEDEIVFAMTEFPRTNSQNFNLVQYELECLNSSASVRINFNDLSIENSSIISFRKKADKPAPRPSRYIGYELGIGKAALTMIKAEAQKTIHPKNGNIEQTVREIEIRIDSISELKKSDPFSPTIGFLASQINYDSVRLLSLALGAKSLVKGSVVSRWMKELILFDTVIQAPETIELKTLSLGKTRTV